MQKLLLISSLIVAYSCILFSDIISLFQLLQALSDKVFPWQVASVCFWSKLEESRLSEWDVMWSDMLLSGRGHLGQSDALESRCNKQEGRN